MSEFLDKTGFQYFWGKLKALLSGKANGNSAGTALKTEGIPFGEVDSTSTATAFTATVPGISELKDGTVVMLRNGVVTSASGFTINVNGLGAKPVYNNMATGNETTPTAPTRDTTIFNINYTMMFIYQSDLVSGGAWICYRGYDANTNTVGYQLRTNSATLPASDTGYRYRLWLTSADGTKWVPINTSTSTNATTARTLNTRKIDPFGAIVYNSTNGTVNANSRPSLSALWQQYTLTVGYSYVLSMTAYKPVYLKCTPQTDGSAVMDVLTQTLPTSKDGKIYIFLGIAYSATAMELRIEHPVYWHDGTGIRIWTGAEPSGGGGTYTLPAATASTLGGVKVGSGLSVTTDGTLSASGGGGWETLSFKDIFDGSSSEYDGTFITNGHLVCVSVLEATIDDCQFTADSPFKPATPVFAAGIVNGSAPAFIIIDPMLNGIMAINLANMEYEPSDRSVSFTATWPLG